MTEETETKRATLRYFILPFAGTLIAGAVGAATWFQWVVTKIKDGDPCGPELPPGQREVLGSGFAASGGDAFDKCEAVRRNFERSNPGTQVDLEVKDFSVDFSDGTLSGGEIGLVILMLGIAAATYAALNRDTQASTAELER